MTTTSIMPTAQQRYFTNAGAPADGYLLYTYAAGTSTPKATYTDSAGTIQHANPIELSGKGEAVIYWDGAYKVNLTSPTGAAVTGYPVDNYTSVDTLIAASDATLRADLAASTGTSLLGHLPDGAGVAATTVQTQLRMLSRTTVYLKSTNTAAQNKTAFQVAIASMTRPGKLLLPDGIFSCNPDIDLGTLVVSIEGGGKYGTYLSNTGATAGTYFFGVGDATLMEYLRFSEFGIDGGGVVAHGLRLATCNHSKFGEILVTGTTSSALYVGGYSNDIVENDLFSNTGSGLYLTGTLNNVDVTRNRIYANDGIGIILLSTDTDAGLSISIHDENAIEANKIAGIVAVNTKGLIVRGNYFERNAATGYAYTVPEAITVRADIHLLSAATFSLDDVDAYANQCPTISGNHTTPIGVYSALPNLDGFIFTTHANNLKVENNQIFDATKIDALVSIYQNRTYSKITGQMELSANTINTVDYIGTYTAASQCHATSHLIRDKSAVLKNYADTNWLSWVLISGSTGTWARSGGTFLGLPVWSMTDGDVGMGFALDTTIWQELQGKWVYFGMWVNAQGASANAQLFIGSNSSAAATDYDTSGDWVFKSVVAFISATPGIVYPRVVKVGTGADLLLCNPVLAVIGNSYNDIPVPSSISWARAGGVVGNGTWKVGDRITNSTPVVGQPKSWVNTVAGSPGTFVSEGNL